MNSSDRRFQHPNPLVKRWPILASGFTALVIFSFASIMVPDDCHAADESETQKIQSTGLAKFVFAGFVAGRHKLTKGKFAIEGTLKESHPEWGEISGEVKVFCAFDFNRRRLRFDRTEPTRKSRDPDTSPVSPRDWIPGIDGGNFILLEDAMIVRHLGHNNISVLPITRTHPPWVRATDVRCLGVGHRLDLDKGVTFESIVSTYEKQLATFPVAVTSESNGVHRVDMTIMDKATGNPSFLRTAWYDSTKDFFPLKLEVRERIGSSIEVDARQQQTLKPIQISNVWVPEKVTLTSDRGNKVEILNYIWESVNTEIDDSVFTPDGFPLDGVDSVVDHRRADLIVTKQYTLPQHLETPNETQRANSWWTLIVGNAFFGTLLLIFYLLPKRDRSTHK